jgi:large subunit ribosomal protein L9
MKIILQKPVEKLGAPGDVVEVADGYAQNYLVPRGLAVAASKGAVKHSESLKRAHASKMEKSKGDAEDIASALGSLPLRITAKAGEDGKLFGSITSADVAEAIESAAEGVEIDKKAVTLDEPIRSTGSHVVHVKLHPEVTADVTVEVEGTEK